LALFRRRPPEGVEGSSPSLPASENLHISGHQMVHPKRAGNDLKQSLIAGDRDGKKCPIPLKKSGLK